MNLVNLVKDQLGGSVINQLGGLLGEGGANTEKAISGAVPSILGGIMNSAGTSDGASRLNRALDDQDDSILDNLGGLLGGGGHTEVANTGSSMLGSLLGGNTLGSLAGALSGFSGMGRGSTGSLIGMLAPIVMSVLRRQRNSQGLDAGGLASFLGGQRDNIASAMPTGLNDHFAKEGLGDSLMGSMSDGVSNVTDKVSNAASNVTGTVSNAAGAVGDAGRSGVSTAAAGTAAAAGAAGAVAATGGGLMRKLIPLLIILVLGWLAWKFLFSGGADKVTDMAKDAGSTVSETASSAASTVSDTASSAATAVTDTAASATSAVTGAATSMVGGDLGGTIDSVFSDATESIGGIKDAASAEAAIPGIEGMADKVSGLSGAFGALGGDAKGKVASMIGDKMPALEGAVNTALGIPGVGDKLGPVITKLMSALNGLTQ